MVGLTLRLYYSFFLACYQVLNGINNICISLKITTQVIICHVSFWSFQLVVTGRSLVCLIDHFLDEVDGFLCVIAIVNEGEGSCGCWTC
jgi:hypothetical protein